MDQVLIETRNEMTRCARTGSLSRFRELFEANKTLRRTKPWLHVASGGHNEEIVDFLLNAGFDPNELGAGSTKQRCLTIACREGQASITKRLLDAGANLNVDNIDDNALFSSIYARSLECVRLLVGAGIDIHQTYDLGHRFKNALAFAEEEGCSEIARYLREHGARLPPAKLDCL